MLGWSLGSFALLTVTWLLVSASWRDFKGVTSNINSRHTFTANSLILCLLEPFLPSLLRCFLSLFCGLKVKASLLWQPVKCYYWRQVPQQLFATWDWLEINHISTGWFLCVIYKHMSVAHWWGVCLPSMDVAHHIKIIVCNLQISFENKMLFLDFGCWCV